MKELMKKWKGNWWGANAKIRAPPLTYLSLSLYQNKTKSINKQISHLIAAISRGKSGRVQVLEIRKGKNLKEDTPVRIHIFIFFLPAC